MKLNYGAAKPAEGNVVVARVTSLAAKAIGGTMLLANLHGCANEEIPKGNNANTDMAKTGPAKDGGVVDAGKQLMCGDFSTNTAFVLVVNGKKMIVHEGDENVAVGPNKYSVAVTEDGKSLLLVAENVTINGKTGKVTVNVNDGSITLEQSGKPPEVSYEISDLGVKSLSEDPAKRYEVFAYYSTRVTMKVTAGDSSTTVIEDQGGKVDVTSVNGQLKASVTVLEGTNKMAVLSASGSAPGVAVAEDIYEVPEGTGITLAQGVGVDVRSAHGEYSAGCRDYQARVLVTLKGGVVKETDYLPEGSVVKLDGDTTATFGKIQYDESNGRRYIDITIVSGNVTVSGTYQFGQAAMVQGGKVTQVMPVDARSVDKQPPVQPEVDAGAGDR